MYSTVLYCTVTIPPHSLGGLPDLRGCIQGYIITSRILCCTLAAGMRLLPMISQHGRGPTPMSACSTTKLCFLRLPKWLRLFSVVSSRPINDRLLHPQCLHVPANSFLRSAAESLTPSNHYDYVHVMYCSVRTEHSRRTCIRAQGGTARRYLYSETKTNLPHLANPLLADSSTPYCGC